MTICPKCSHLVNPYSGQCQNIHCDYVRGQALESPYVELTPSFDFSDGPLMGTCANCGASVEVGLYGSPGRPLCVDCFFAPVPPQVLAGQIASRLAA